MCAWARDVRGGVRVAHGAESLHHSITLPLPSRAHRFLSDGNDFRDCGDPCERHTVQLRDASGADHLVLADM
jgi:hypothetical protein